MAFPKRKAVGWQLVGRGTPSEAPTNDNWTAKPLTYAEIERMSAAEAEWHVQHNKKNWEAAFEEQERRRASKLLVAKTRIELAWSGHSTPQEDEAAIRAGQSFASSTPSFPRTLEAATLMCEYMKRENLDAGVVGSYTKAFNALVETGQIKLAPVQSANEYLARHAELHDTRIPPLIAARHQREQNTEAHFAAASTATSESTVTRVVDYGEQKHGVPPESEKYSFKMKVRAMSADELAQRCADDPAFKTALDALE